jgi:hypothetical protein
LLQSHFRRNCKLKYHFYNSKPNFEFVWADHKNDTQIFVACTVTLFHFCKCGPFQGQHVAAVGCS